MLFSKHHDYRIVGWILVVILPHTYLGKCLGGFIFILPIAVHFGFGQPWMAVICSIMSIAVFEIFYIQAKNKTAKDFIPTIFHVDK